MPVCYRAGKYPYPHQYKTNRINLLFDCPSIVGHLLSVLYLETYKFKLTTMVELHGLANTTDVGGSLRCTYHWQDLKLVRVQYKLYRLHVNVKLHYSQMQPVMRNSLICLTPHLLCATSPHTAVCKYPD